MRLFFLGGCVVDFFAALPGHLNYGSIAMGRAEIVLQRIAEIAGNY